MALWQYTFYLMPNEIFSHEEKNFKISIDDFGSESVVFWWQFGYGKQTFKTIERFLPLGKTWSKDLTVFGELDSNCFEVFCENEVVIDVSFRINYKSQYDFILSEIIEFCILNGFAVLDEELNFVDLNLTSMKQIIGNAPQVKLYDKLSQKPEPDSSNCE